MDHIDENELLASIRASLVEQATKDGIELDEEQLDELSKHTLHSYAAKAKGSAQAARKISKFAASRDEDERAEKFADKAKKRDAGSKKASAKLSEEEIDEHLKEILGEEEYGQLDELSKKTLGSYVKKASRDASSKLATGWVHGMSKDGNIETAQKSVDKAGKRHRGIDTAVKKLTRESIEEMIASAHEGKPVEFAAAFNTALRDVIDTKMEAMRTDVAASLFSASQE